MYIIKDEFKNIIGNKRFNKLLKKYNIKQKEIAKIIGIGDGYMSQIANGEDITKLCAYAVCKAISPDLEIQDLFNIKNY